jgi:type I restriction enzyme S subunit
VIDGLKPYPATKDSGVPWIGEVPAHWERRRLKSLLRPVDQRSSTGTETLLSLRRDHGVVVYSEHFARPSQGATAIGYKLVRKEQLVLNRLQANNGLVFDSAFDGLVSPDYSVFEPRQALRVRFLSLLLRTQTYKDHFRREATGLGTGSAGFLRLYDDRFLETPVFLPSIAEQDGALRFLDYADRCIRRYIRGRKRLISLLNEQKRAVIHRALTRGLTPQARLKGSGAEWLGDIPEHWEVRQLRQIVSVVGGRRQAWRYVDTGTVISRGSRRRT